MNLSGVNGENSCVEDIATTHTIIKDKIYFSQLKLVDANVNTIFGVENIIEG
jgi:hypothetical protein